MSLLMIFEHEVDARDGDAVAAGPGAGRQELDEAALPVVGAQRLGAQDAARGGGEGGDDVALPLAGRAGHLAPGQAAIARQRVGRAVFAPARDGRAVEADVVPADARRRAEPVL